MSARGPRASPGDPIQPLSATDRVFDRSAAFGARRRQLAKARSGSRDL
jgi:hypothetical protein